jgi:hypothetical protein
MLIKGQEPIMRVENIEIADIDGCESDGWAAPKVRLRLVAKRRISALAFEFWFPEEEQNNEPALLVLSAENAKTQFIEVSPSTPKEVILQMALEENWEVSVMITCDHLIENKGEDKRCLSYMLLSLKGIAV